jgi:hypothetical protein
MFLIKLDRKVFEGGEQASKRAARPSPAQQELYLGPGGPDHKSYWAGRAMFFVGPARPEVLSFIFPVYQLYVYHK